MPDTAHKTIVVLGASGLIGRHVVDDLRDRGLDTVGVARSFPQWMSPSDMVRPLLQMDEDALAAMLLEYSPRIVVNCVGTLQDASAMEIHCLFVARLLEAIKRSGLALRLVHFSVPDGEGPDPTRFSRTKRAAESLIVTSGVPHTILRPGFVIAPAAYGGGAMIRALAVSSFRLPRELTRRPFQTVSIGDVAKTVAFLAERPESRWNEIWTLVHPHVTTVGEVVSRFRRSLGTRTPRFALPNFLLAIGARLGDVAARLGWSPPMRTAALQELRRGIQGNPEAWTAATGIVPASLAETVAHQASVQDKWFARLYLAKAASIAVLSAFWIASGLIASAVSFNGAALILTSVGTSDGTAFALTAGTSLLDVAVGLLIAFRRTCGFGLMLGIAVSLAYLALATLAMPSLWWDPLGALVKVVPLLVMMRMTMAMLDKR